MEIVVFKLMINQVKIIAVRADIFGIYVIIFWTSVCGNSTSKSQRTCLLMQENSELYKAR